MGLDNILDKRYLPIHSICYCARKQAEVLKMCEELEQEEKDLIAKFYPTPPMTDYVRYPGPVIMPRTFVPIKERIRNFKVKPDDIWIVTYPKSGTTWTQEMIWQIVNNVDRERGQLPLFTRTPFLEFGCVTNDMPFGCPPGMPPHVCVFYISIAKL